MAERTDSVGGSVIALRILALILAALSLYNVFIPTKIAVGISGLGVAALSGIVLPPALRRNDGRD